MSIKVMSHVWEHSKQKGSALLLMLALADLSDDNGDCFPGVARLAEKTRVEERNIKRMIAKLEVAGELRVFTEAGLKTGNGWTNLYRVVMNERQASAPLKTGRYSSERGGKIITPRPAKRGVVKTSPHGVVAGSPDPSVDPSGKDQEQKEVVVASRYPRVRLPIFTTGPAFVIARQSAAASKPVEAPHEPDDADFVIALHGEYFGAALAPTHQEAQAAVVTYTLPEVRLALEDALTEKRKDETKTVRWSYVKAILERRYQQQLDRAYDSTPHADLVGMRPHYQFPNAADNLIYQHPLWQAYRAKWSDLTGRDVIVPPTSVHRYAETARLLDTLDVTPEEVNRLLERKFAAGKVNYSFLFMPEHIGEIHAEDAMKNRQRDPALIAAVCTVWKVGEGDFANAVADILSGMTTPPTPEEVTKFGAWYAAQPQFKTQAKPPSTPDNLTLRLNEYRGQRRASSSAPRHTFTPAPKAAPLSAEERDRIKREVQSRQQPEGATP